MAVFRGVLIDGGEDLSDPGAPRFFLDDGQAVGRFDETSFILNAGAFIGGRVDDDTVIVLQHSCQISIATDRPMSLG
jgi:hypothetical protein